MSNKVERRSVSDDLIDDIIESSHKPPLSYTTNTLKTLNKPNYSSLPSLKYDSTDNLLTTLSNELRDRLHSPMSHSNLSSTVMSNDERRKEIDLIIKHLHDGKLLASINDDLSTSDTSEKSARTLRKRSITNSSTRNDDENKTIVPNLDLLSLDNGVTSLQHELHEKELDIIHLHKEIQELHLENKLLKSKVPSAHSSSYTNNNSETDALRREKDILLNEVRISQELIAKLQLQQHQNLLIQRSNRFDDIAFHQKEIIENQLKSCEKQIRFLNNENDKLKQSLHQIDRIVVNLKRENNELQEKINQVKKRNDDLFYQELTSFRNDLKMLKERNNDLVEENLRLQNEQQISPKDAKNSKTIRNEYSNNSEEIFNIERFNSRSFASSVQCSTATGENYRRRPTRFNSPIEQGNFHRNDFSTPISKSVDRQSNRHSPKAKCFPDWDEEAKICENDDIEPLTPNYQSIHSSATPNSSESYSRRAINDNQDDRYRTPKTVLETNTPKRPFAPLSINEIRLNDLIKFSRPGGKISKGVVKYIGKLPGRNESYLGLELEDEETRHDGIYENQRFFQCKPNRGVFVDFHKVIMAWSDK